MAAMLIGGAAHAASPASLDATLQPYLASYGLPALAAAVARGGDVIAAGAVGTRRWGTTAPVGLDDRFHLGSDTKPMTALLAAMLVEQGKLRWDSTIGEVFPELAGRMDPGLAKVTLAQLLSHSSGVPADDQAFEDAVKRSETQEGNLDELRYWLLREWCPQKLVATPGTTYAYANMNYVIVGAMIERVTGRTWDELMVEKIFTPLHLRSAGLGNQASLGRVDAPLGHDPANGSPKPMLSGPNGDNPPVIGPAGIAHMSVKDFARWAAWSAGEGARPPALVTPETMRKLHTALIPIPALTERKAGTPWGARYGFGWAEVSVEWAPQPLIYDGGSNGLNVAQIWIDTANDSAIVLMTNIGGTKAEQGLFAAAGELYRQYLAPGAPPLPTPVVADTPEEKAAPAAPLRKPRAYFPGDTRRGVGD
jgi:CubicO group peptidase (beta-lactamase class C family)